MKLSKIIDEFKLEVLRGQKDYENRPIRTEDVNRPGLQLTGFFDYFDAKRLQVIGRVETTYL
ncbi:MAG: HPr kinase/phosphorylase, partial [Oscillospiraceae bacterium]